MSRLRCLCLLPSSAVVLLALVASSYATVTTQYSFENNLSDSAASGTTADNLTPFAFSGVPTTSYQPGIVGDAVLVSAGAGEATVLQAASSVDLNLAASWTIEAFVKPDSANTGEWDRFVTKWFDGGNQYHWAFRDQVGSVNGQDLFMNGVQFINSGAAGTPTVPLNAWSHVAFTGSPIDGIRLWQDGVVVGSAAYAPVNASGGAAGDAFRIGNFNTTAGQAPLQFSGLVDELLIHDVAHSNSYMEARTALIPIPPPPPVEPPPASGLVSYWTFENSVEDVASDFSQNVGVAEDDLTPRGGVANYEPGQVGQALRVGVNAGDNTDLSGLLTDDVKLPATYTIEAWINPTQNTGTWQRLVLNWGGADFAYHFAIQNGNQVSLFHGESDGGQPNTQGGAIVPGEWSHVAGVADGTNLRVYLNGEEVASTPYDGTIATTITEGLGIGDSFSSLSAIKFEGLLDDLAIWNIPLTPEQIRFQFQNGENGKGALIPEPTAGLLGLLGVVGGLFVRRRSAA